MALDSGNKIRILVTTQVVDRTHPILGFFHTWIEMLARECESVTVICLEEGEHDFPSNVHVLSLGKEVGTSRLVRIQRFYRFILADARPYNAVFVHMNPEYIVLGGLIWRLMKKRIVLWYTHKSVTLTLRLATFFAHTVCTASPESFRIKTPKKVVTGHGIDASLFLSERPARGDVYRFITAGRITPTKNIDVLIEAMAFLPRYGIPYHFSIVGGPTAEGDKEYLQGLKNRVHELNAERFIEFHGSIDPKKMPGVLAKADAFLHASATGSLDKAVLEAMAAGCVVISASEAVRPIMQRIERHLVVDELRPELFAEAIAWFSHANPREEVEIRERAIRVVREQHSLLNLMQQLLWILSKSK
ncbi:MAG: glycosyltransferase family 4 protein [Patescibacteria group bacterium]